MTAPIILETYWTAIPLNLNDRGATKGAVYAKAAKVKQIRETIVALCIHNNIPQHVAHAVVEFHYRPKDRRRRDVDNLYATLKAAFDGFVDYGLVSDDTPDLMSKPEPVLHKPSKVPAMWFEITVKNEPREAPE